jgi:hypothetical protein
MEVIDLLRPYQDLFPETDIQTWLDTPGNFYLREGDNLALFAYQYDGLYIGHYFFVARGKEARDLGKRFIKKAFEREDVKVIEGLTPLTNLGARWMSRQLGFKSHGVVETRRGFCELFLLTKEQHNE